MTEAGERESDQKSYRLFVVLLVLEAIVLTIWVVRESPATPWWLPGLLVLSPVGWILPGVVAFGLYRPSSSSPDAVTAAERSAPRSPKPDYSRLPVIWEQELRAMAFGVDHLYGIVDRLYQNEPETVSPKRRLVFRAFHLTAPSEVRVVLVGQDPYVSRSMADGLAFSQRGAVEPGSSLDRIFANLATDSRIHFIRPERGRLDDWAAGGVLLLNRALTVATQPGSHLAHWSDFCRMILQIVYRQQVEAVYLCFGRPAVNLVKDVLFESDYGSIVETSHPAARDLENSDLRRFQSARPFSEVDDLLLRRGLSPIDWRL